MIRGTFDPHRNAVGVLRLGLAWVVIVSHSFVLTGNTDPLVAVTGGQEGLGGLAVVGFFVLSGYLITRSLDHARPTRFLWHRFLRIMPGYWICILATALAASLAGHGAADYLAGNVLLIQGSPSIDGILVNGSLWTLAPEFVCYLGLLFLAVRRPIAGTFVIAGAAYLATVLRLEFPLYWLPVWPLAFALGSLGYRLTVRIDHRLALLAGVVIAGSLLTRTYAIVYPIPMAYLVLWAMTLRAPTPRWDLSYGTYIYAFPIQQTLILAGLTNPVGIAIAAAPLVSGAAALSWLLVERPALRLKGLSRSVTVTAAPVARTRRRAAVSGGGTAARG